MAGPEFWQTPMGRTFYESTLPELIRSINHLAKAIDGLVKAKKSVLFRIIEEEVAKLCENVDIEKLLANIDSRLSNLEE